MLLSCNSILDDKMKKKGKEKKKKKKRNRKARNLERRKKSGTHYKNRLGGDFDHKFKFVIRMFLLEIHVKNS